MIITIITFIIVFGILVLVHEFGHYYFAKRAGILVREFSIGMGPLIKTHKGKDGINYNIRALPIGGFVSMAGEVYEDDDTKKIKKEDFMCNKKWWQRVIILAAGVFNNFLLAIVILFIMALIWGANSLEPKVGTILEDSAAETGGLKEGDLILSINDHKVSTWDQTQIVLYLKNDSNIYEFEILRDGKTLTLELEPDITETETGEEQKTFGFGIEQKTEKVYGLVLSMLLPDFGV